MLAVSHAGVPMGKRPSFQFYPADWRKDPALRACSLAARGLWVEMLALMHECEPYGHLRIGGSPVTDTTQVARLVGESPDVVATLLAELEQFAVFSRLDDGTIYSRRMVRDEHVRAARAAGGMMSLENPNVPRRKKGAPHGPEEGHLKGYPSRISSGGSLGGSPSSSSSSSSSTTTTPEECVPRDSVPAPESSATSRELTVPAIARLLTTAANAGLDAAFGVSIKPLVPGHRPAIALAEHVQQQHIDVAFAALVIERHAKSLNPVKTERPFSLGYFRPILDTAHAEVRPRRVLDVLRHHQLIPYNGNADIHARRVEATLEVLPAEELGWLRPLLLDLNPRDIDRALAAGGESRALEVIAAALDPSRAKGVA